MHAVLYLATSLASAGLQREVHFHGSYTVKVALLVSVWLNTEVLQQACARMSRALHRSESVQ